MVSAKYISLLLAGVCILMLTIIMSVHFSTNPLSVEDVQLKLSAVKAHLDQSLAQVSPEEKHKSAEDNSESLQQTLPQQNSAVEVSNNAQVLDPYGELTGGFRPNFDPPGIEPCGVTCTYTGILVNNNSVLYPQLRKDIDCQAILKRMTFKNHNITYPPPEKPPQQLRQLYEMYGDMNIERYLYFMTKHSLADNIPANFSEAKVQRYIDDVKAGDKVNTYNDGICVENMLKNFSDNFKNKRGIVIGTQRPWLESIFLANGASNVTTLEYQPLIYGHPQLDSFTPYDYADKYLKGEVVQLDFAASYSSIEHSGLGRYNDPLNPYGDLEAVAQVWCLMKPGGMFALGLPFEDFDNKLYWNAHRVYGRQRLQFLTANWKIVDYAICNKHIFIILTKEEY